jgi:putative ABC transport system substrate-binding protein
MADGRYDRLPGLAAELVRLKVNVILASVPVAIQAAKQATETIPIVITGAADPVAAGFVTSLARPGGNITGVSLMMPDLVGKQLKILKEVVPKLSRVALLGNPANPSHAMWLRGAQDAASALAVRLQVLEARDPCGIDNAFKGIITERADAVIVLSDATLMVHRARIADHAVRRRLPTVSGLSEFAEAGVLLAYGPSIADGVRRAAIYIDKILKGAKPADLPVEQPTKFELVVNLKTATALGLTMPKSVLVQATEVIQ